MGDAGSGCGVVGSRMEEIGDSGVTATAPYPNQTKGHGHATLQRRKKPDKNTECIEMGRNLSYKFNSTHYQSSRMCIQSVADDKLRSGSDCTGAYSPHYETDDRRAG